MTRMVTSHQDPPAKVLRRLALAVAMLSAGVLATLTTSSLPVAADAMLAVTPADGLDPAGAFVVVSGSGYPADTQLFVMQCKASSGDDHTCNSVGLRKVTTDASGSFTANAMRLVSRFGATDCLVDGCSVMTSAVSGHSGDRSLDRSVAISFAAPVPDTVPPPVVTDPVPTTAAPTTSPTDTAVDASSSVPDSTTSAPSTTAPSTTPSTSATSSTSDEAAESASSSDDRATTLSESDDNGAGGGSGTVVAVGAGAAVVVVGAAGVVALRRRQAS